MPKETYKEYKQRVGDTVDKLEEVVSSVEEDLITIKLLLQEVTTHFDKINTANLKNKLETALSILRRVV